MLSGVPCAHGGVEVLLRGVSGAGVTFGVGIRGSCCWRLGSCRWRLGAIAGVRGAVWQQHSGTFVNTPLQRACHQAEKVADRGVFSLIACIRPMRLRRK